MKQIVLAAFVAVSFATAANASGARLVREWIEKGQQMCQYDNGTVLNVGGRRCPTSI